MRPLVVLGATGSIGRQTLEVAERLGLEIAGLGANLATPAFGALMRRHPEARAVLADVDGAGRREGGESLPGVEFGSEALVALAAMPGCIVVNGIVGAAGLEATLAALGAGNRLALANKESMVTAGELVAAAKTASGAELIPVDSEHSALFQCLAGEHSDDVARLVLTASGGPFRGRDRSQLSDVGPDEALRHPTWNMGGRITIDSATLVNKGLEVIEAHHMFGLDFDRIAVVVHPQSIMHSAVEFVDGALKAHIGYPDMRIPIQYALTYPRRRPGPGGQFELAAQDLVFEPVDRTAFPALDLAYEAGRLGGSAPAIYNAADEVAVAAFLEGRLGFLAIAEVLASALERVSPQPISGLADVWEVDAEARRVAGELVDRMGLRE
ncbi:MAG TPA: 1-deoxy-D-xylulose-5-phosphate reductoisomerase [Acidimicrobiia bacterium]|nr:1-deoxy-D-xylulose-5-phosphate reductoisomerase [Acidimicrobiia bacterium]